MFLNLLLRPATSTQELVLSFPDPFLLSLPCPALTSSTFPLPLSLHRRIQMLDGIIGIITTPADEATRVKGVVNSIGDRIKLRLDALNAVRCTFFLQKDACMPSALHAV